MSKPKNIEEFGVRSEKAKAALRRKETARVKETRLKKCAGGEYSFPGFPAGYREKNSKWIGKYKTITVPAHTEEKSVLSHWEHRKLYGKEGNTVFPYEIMVPVYKKVTERVPKRTVKVLVSREEIPIPKRPVRINCSKSYYKKKASRKVRRCTEDTVVSSYFRKLGNFVWDLA